MAGAPTPEMEKLRDQFALETDPAKQKTIAEAVQLQATKMVSHIPLGQWYNRSLMRKNLVGMMQAPATPVFWNVEQSVLSIVPSHETHHVLSHGEHIGQFVLESEMLRDHWHINLLNKIGRNLFIDQLLNGFDRIGDAQMGCEQFDSIFLAVRFRHVI
jgi:hypothetical protein